LKSFFTIIIIASGKIDLLRQTLTSIEEQTFEEKTVLLIQRGRIELPGENKGRVDKIIIEPEVNRYQAMNAGVQYAEGEYVIIFYEGDKFADKYALHDSFEFLEGQGKPDIIYGDRIKFRGSLWYYKPARSHQKLTLGMFAEIECMVIKRTVFQKEEIPTGYQEAGDYAFVAQLLNEPTGLKVMKFDRIFCQVLLNEMHEGDIFRKVAEDWQIQRDYVGSGFLLRSLVFAARLASQLLRRLSRALFGALGHRTDPIPMSRNQRLTLSDIQ